MRILFFHRWVGVHKGGTESHLRELADRFQQLGHQVTILTREGNELGDFNSSVKVVRVSRNWKESEHSYEDLRVYWHTLIFMAKSFFKLLSLLHKSEYFDVISVHFFTELWVAKLYSFFKKTPIVFILEGYTPMEAQAARFADRRICISEFEATMYRQKHSVDSIVIPVGIDRLRFSARKNKAEVLSKRIAPSGEKIVLTVCRLEPRKDLVTLLKAVKHAGEKFNGLKFVIVGDGISRKYLEREIQSNGLQEKVILAGRVEDAALPLYYAMADFFVLPTKQEWFGIVFLEAMAAGLPVITTDVDACPEVVGDCGLYFKSGDYQVLAEKIDSLAKNQELLQELSSRALKRSERFDWELVIKEYEQQFVFN